MIQKMNWELSFSTVVWETDWNIASCTHSHIHTMFRLLLNRAAAHALSINTAEFQAILISVLGIAVLSDTTFPFED